MAVNHLQDALELPVTLVARLKRCAGAWGGVDRVREGAFPSGPLGPGPVQSLNTLLPKPLIAFEHPIGLNYP